MVAYQHREVMLRDKICQQKLTSVDPITLLGMLVSNLGHEIW